MKIICAALLITVHEDVLDKYPHITKNTFILPCYRHSDGYHFFKDFIGFNRHDFEIKEGFLTNKNTFLSRKEAYELVKEDLPAEIKNLKYIGSSQLLYSEDLY